MQGCRVVATEAVAGCHHRRRGCLAGHRRQGITAIECIGANLSQSAAQGNACQVTATAECFATQRDDIVAQCYVRQGDATHESTIADGGDISTDGYICQFNAATESVFLDSRYLIGHALVGHRGRNGHLATIGVIVGRLAAHTHLALGSNLIEDAVFLKVIDIAGLVNHKFVCDLAAR